MKLRKFYPKVFTKKWFVRRFERIIKKNGYVLKPKTDPASPFYIFFTKEGLQIMHDMRMENTRLEYFVYNRVRLEHIIKERYKHLAYDEHFIRNLEFKEMWRGAERYEKNLN